MTYRLDKLRLIFLLFLVQAGIFYCLNQVQAEEYAKPAALIKTLGSPKVYAVLDGKKHWIKNEQIFLDYGYKWSEIKTVSDSYLNNLPDVKFIKKSGDPKVYYLDRKLQMKKWQPNEEVFLKYGNKWSDIVTLSQLDLDVWSEINLVKVKGNAKIYLLEGNKKRHINDPTVFNALGYDWSKVVEIKDFDLSAYQEGQPVTESDKPMPTVSDSVTVSLPLTEQKTFASGSASQEIFSFYLTAAGTSTNLKEISLAVNGLNSSQDFDEITLWSGNEMLARRYSYNQRKINFRLSDAIKLLPETSKNFSVKVDFLNQIPTIGLSIEKSSDIILSDAREIKGKFPLLGPMHKVLNGSGILGRAKIENVPVAVSGLNVSLGAKDQVITKFKIAETSGLEDLRLDSLTLEDRGTVRDGDLTNFELLQNNKVIAKVEKASSHYLIFDLAKNPLIIKKSDDLEITVRADVSGGENSRSQLVIERPQDVVLVGKTYNFNIRPENNFPVGNPDSFYNALIIGSGQILVYKNEKFKSNKLIAGSQEQVIASFDLRVSGYNVEWQGLKIRLAEKNTVTPLTGMLRIKGPKDLVLYSLDANRLADWQEVRLFELVTINSGSVYNFQIVADISSNAKIGETYTIEVSGLNFEKLTNNEFLTFDQVVSSSTRAVDHAALMVTIDSSFTNQIYPAGAAKLKIGVFKLVAGSGEAIVVKNIKIASVGDSTRPLYSNGYNNLKLSSKTIAAPNSYPIDFNDLNIKISAGRDSKIEIYVDTNIDNDGDKINLAIESVEAYGQTSGAEVKVEGIGLKLQEIELKKPTLTFSLNNNFTGGEIVAGTKKSKIASFKLVNNNVEDVNITSLTIVEVGGFASLSTNRGYQNLSLYKNNRSSDTIKLPQANSNIFDGKILIKKNEEIILDVFVDLPAEGVVGDQIKIILQNVDGQGSTSKVRTTVTGLPVEGQVLKIVAKSS